jgi:hypothetical protein
MSTFSCHPFSSKQLLRAFASKGICLPENWERLLDQVMTPCDLRSGSTYAEIKAAFNIALKKAQLAFLGNTGTNSTFDVHHPETHVIYHLPVQLLPDDKIKIGDNVLPAAEARLGMSPLHLLLLNLHNILTSTYLFFVGSSELPITHLCFSSK